MKDAQFQSFQNVIIKSIRNILKQPNRNLEHFTKI